MVVQAHNRYDFDVKFYPNPICDLLYLFGTVIFCANEECNKYTLSLEVIQGHRDIRHAPNGEEIFDDVLTSRNALNHWDLLPESCAMPVPDYIPKAIADDYMEACRIQNLSPKASATLSRRCLQGMIRDFWKVSERNLWAEIEAIKDKVDEDTWDAIHAIRKIGNIGAHMEKDINVIVDVEPEEAQLLVGLIETLFEEWYISRHDRQLRMKRVQALAADKEAERAGGSKATS